MPRSGEEKASAGIERALRRQNKYLRAIAESTVDLLSHVNHERLLEKILQRAVELLGAAGGSLDVLDRDTNRLIPTLAIGIAAPSADVEVGPGEGLMGVVWETGRPIIVEDYDSWACRPKRVPFGLARAAMAVPLVCADSLVGVLAVAHDRDSNLRFDQESLDLLTEFARYATLALENARLYRAAEKELSGRRRVETELRASQQAWEKTFESIGDWICLLSPEGQILRTNAAGESLLGVSTERIVGHPCYRLVHGRETPLADCPLVKAKASRKRESLEIQRGDGDRWLHVTVDPVLGPDGDVESLVHIVRDITAAKLSELEIARLQDAMAHLSRVGTLAELSGSLGHELNQPLQAIGSNARAGLLQLQSPEFDKAELCETLQDILADDRRAAEIIRRMREHLKRGDLALKRVDLNDLVSEIAVFIKTHAHLAGVTIQLRLSSDPLVILADRVRLQQVCLNLLLNAVEACQRLSSARDIVVTTRRTPEGAVQLEVLDSGPGIPETDLTRIFEPFYTTKKKGIGLGLCICRSLATAHGGRIWAENRPEGGARFILEFGEKLRSAPA